MVEGDGAFRDQANGLCVDLAVDEEEVGGLAERVRGFDVFGLFAVFESLVVAVEALLDAFYAEGKLVDGESNLRGEIEKGECPADLVVDASSNDEVGVAADQSSNGRGVRLLRDNVSV